MSWDTEQTSPNRSGLALTGGGQAGTREWAVSIGIGPAKAEPNHMPSRFGVRSRKALAAQEAPHPFDPWPDSCPPIPRSSPFPRVNTMLGVTPRIL